MNEAEEGLFLEFSVGRPIYASTSHTKRKQKENENFTKVLPS